MRIPKHYLKYFIEQYVEPLLNPVLEKEIVVTYDEASGTKKLKENSRDIYPVSLISKVHKVPNLFGGFNDEYLVNTVKFSDIGIVKSKKERQTLVECKMQSCIFFLEFNIDNEPEPTTIKAQPFTQERFDIMKEFEAMLLLNNKEPKDGITNNSPSKP